MFLTFCFILLIGRTSHRPLLVIKPTISYFFKSHLVIIAETVILYFNHLTAIPGTGFAFCSKAALVMLLVIWCTVCNPITSTILSLILIWCHFSFSFIRPLSGRELMTQGIC